MIVTKTPITKTCSKCLSCSTAKWYSGPTCQKCYQVENPVKRPTDYKAYHKKHRARLLASQVKYRSKPTTKIKVKDKYLKKRYGISLDDYQALLKFQNNVCLICEKSTSRKTDSGLIVDHDHLTGKVRGLLCHFCNVAIGLFKEDISNLTKAIEYLRKSRT